jgi:hypothetical protein
MYVARSIFSAEGQVSPEISIVPAYARARARMGIESRIKERILKRVFSLLSFSLIPLPISPSQCKADPSVSRKRTEALMRF